MPEEESQCNCAKGECDCSEEDVIINEEITKLDEYFESRNIDNMTVLVVLETFLFLLKNQGAMDYIHSTNEDDKKPSDRLPKAIIAKPNTGAGIA